MKRVQNYVKMMITAALCLTVVVLVGCNSTVQTYKGDALSLEEVAVITTSEASSPIVRIDRKQYGQSYRAGNEYHLLPGEHTIQVVTQQQNVDGSLNTSHIDLTYDFQAGKVYTIQRSQAEYDAELCSISEWAPFVEFQGDVVGYAEVNPKYQKGSKAWKQLRVDHGLIKTWKDKAPKLTWNWFKKDDVAETEVIAEDETVDQM